MPLQPGDKLGPYEILAPIGAGGMGEVYRARDPRLKRDVAIKVSAAQFSERFEREAKAVAALNHPNICQLYDVGASTSSSAYLVMEFVEGHPLRGPLPLDEALRIAGQIAEALEAAHEKGIVHRDLKPANILLKPDGLVKVLDFGLAKFGPLAAASGGDPENSPTLTMAATQAGVILGTAGYMSPEQARGKTADARADIWAFGVVLYELLTGKRLFKGEDVTDTLASILKIQPDLSVAPYEVRRLLEACLQKDPKQRLQAIGDWNLLLDRQNSPAIGGAGPGGAPRRSAWGWIAAGVLAAAAAALGFAHFRERPPEPRLITTAILPPGDTTFNFNSDNPLAISPDGKRMVFGARSNGASKLWMRSLDSPAARALDGTENAQFPFWSPDSKSIGFFADRKLKRIDVTGGPALTIADARTPRGGAWSPEGSPDGTIVYSPANPGGLLRVAAAGGTPTPATPFDTTKDRSHRFPWFLPDGRHFLVEDQPQVGSNDDVLRIGSLDSKEVKTIGPSNSNAMYAQGYLLFLRENTLVAQPFDENRLATTGDAAPVAEGVQTAVPAGSVGVFCVSRDGLLVYQTGSGGSGMQLTWFDRAGKPMGTLGEPGDVSSLEFSPDRKRVAVTLTGQNSDLWIYDAAGGLRTRFTFDPGVERDASWAPDERSLVYSSDQKGHFDLYRKRTDLNGTEEVLYADGAPKDPSSWSRDGKFLLFTLTAPKTASGIWVLPVTSDAAGKPFPFLQMSFDAKFSPDGKWVAYASYESGRPEIYVAPFPGPGGKRQISTAGGLHARWRDDGNELFYVDPGGILMAAGIAAKGGSIEVGAVRSLGIPTVTTRGWTYDVAADGQRFLVAARPEQKSSEPLTLVSNWTMLLKK
jgi:Tol biopolymer transport system component